MPDANKVILEINHSAIIRVYKQINPIVDSNFPNNFSSETQAGNNNGTSLFTPDKLVERSLSGSHHT